jgi:hypothetical protein
MLEQVGNNISDLRWDHLKTIENTRKNYDRLSIEIDALTGAVISEYERNGFSTETKNTQSKIKELAKKRHSAIKTRTEIISKFRDQKLRLIDKSDETSDADLEEDLDSIYFQYSSLIQDDRWSERYLPEQEKLFLSISVNEFLQKMPLDLGPFFIVRVKQNVPTFRSEDKLVSDEALETGLDQSKVDELKKIAHPCCCCDPDRRNDKKDSTRYKIAYQSNLVGTIKIKHLDSLYAEDHGIRTIPATRINISGTDYLIFTHIITFQPGEEWILCKGVEASTFEAESRQIDVYHIVFAILIGLFILLAMPVMKLLIMSGIERLRIVNVWFTGFSIIVGTALLMMILIAGIQHVGHKKTVSKNLEELAKHIEIQFSQEVLSITAELDSLKRKSTLINRLHTDEKK